MTDTIVQEIRRLRAERARSFAYDLKKVMSDAMMRDHAKRENSKCSTKVLPSGKTHDELAPKKIPAQQE